MDTEYVLYISYEFHRYETIKEDRRRSLRFWKGEIMSRTMAGT